VVFAALRNFSARHRARRLPRAAYRDEVFPPAVSIERALAWIFVTALFVMVLTDWIR